MDFRAAAEDLAAAESQKLKKRAKATADKVKQIATKSNGDADGQGDEPEECHTPQSRRV